MSIALVMKSIGAFKVFGPLLKKIRVDEVNKEMFDGILSALGMDMSPGDAAELLGSMHNASQTGADKNLYEFLSDPRTMMKFGPSFASKIERVDKLPVLTMDSQVMCPECLVFHPVFTLTP